LNVSQDHLPYFKYAGKSRLDKAIKSLAGIIEGIAIDGQITVEEVGFLNAWILDNDKVRNHHPFNELIPAVENALKDGALTDDEREDLLWLCRRITDERLYFDATTSDMQRLHGVLGGVLADGVVTEAELSGLRDWLADHEHLKTLWPYDEVDSLVSSVMRDGRIDDDEQRELQSFFSEFIGLADDQTITAPAIKEGTTLKGLCAVAPEIDFSGSVFCFTGASYKYSRADFEAVLSGLGGKYSKSVTKKVNYLVIGAEGNPCWAYACYGRKVEEAVNLRKSGGRIMLIHEADFHDAVLDN
jgi:hypothetical protein